MCTAGRRRLLTAGLLLFGMACWLWPALGVPSSAAQRDTPRVLELNFSGAIGPASEDYILRGIREAEARDMDAIVLRLDTPGGLDTSMRSIIQAILAAARPIILYVHPAGSRAASAGTYMLYASHVAAMAPGTNLGAATPVAIGGGFPGTDDKDDEDAKPASDRESASESENEETGSAAADGNTADSEREGATGSRPPAAGSAMEAKVTNDAIAYIRSLAEMRGRNARWAESAVRDAESLPASEALKRNVIDVVASDVPDLLEQIEGRRVEVRGDTVTLNLSGALLEPYPPNWRIKLLAAITNPNVALILMAIGFYGLVFEFMNPGSLVPGTIGAIALLLGLYALSALPLSMAGIGLMLLGLCLVIAEAFMPSFGVLGIGGVVAFILGATVLMDTEAPGFEIAWPVVLGMAAVTVVFTLAVVRLAIKSSSRKVKTGRRGLIGKTGTVADWSAVEGHVFADGERWSAVAKNPLAAGQTVEIIDVDGITLTVTPIAAKPVATTGATT